MEMRHHSQVIAPHSRFAVCGSLVCYCSVKSFLVSANTNGTIVINALEMFAITTYRLLVKLDVIHRNLVFLTLVKVLSQPVPHTFHNTYSHNMLLFR